MSSTTHKSVKTFLAALIAVLALAGSGWAVDVGQMAKDASEKIDEALTDTANEFNREFKQNIDNVNRQYNEQQGLESQQPGRLPQLNQPQGNIRSGNMNYLDDPGFGQQTGIADLDRQIGDTVNQANRELNAAGKRDDYTMSRRELETTRNLTFPGTPEYEALSEQIHRLDQDFVGSQK